METGLPTMGPGFKSRQINDATVFIKVLSNCMIEDEYILVHSQESR